MEKEKVFIPALGYNFLTAYYDFTIKLTMPEKKFRRLLVDEVSPKAGERILEFGFGTGQNLPKLILITFENITFTILEKIHLLTDPLIT